MLEVAKTDDANAIDVPTIAITMIVSFQPGDIRRNQFSTMITTQCAKPHVHHGRRSTEQYC
jgi:hypothetical protein